MCHKVTLIRIDKLVASCIDHAIHLALHKVQVVKYWLNELSLHGKELWQLSLQHVVQVLVILCRCLQLILHLIKSFNGLT